MDKNKVSDGSVPTESPKSITLGETYRRFKNSVTAFAGSFSAISNRVFRTHEPEQSKPLSPLPWLDEEAIRSRSTKAKIGYIKTLDGWRAIAISIVIFAHAHDSLTAYFGPNALFDLLSEQGLFGVRIFFSLSGFLITLRIIEEIENRGTLNLLGFYIRRCFRILPPLYLFCLVTAVLGVLGIMPLGLLEWISGPLFFTNLVDDKTWFIGHLWSLSVEEHFYLLWPAAIVAISMTKLPRIILLLVATIGVWRIVAWKNEFYTSVEVFWGRTDIQFDGLLWGCFFAILYRYGNKKIVSRLSTPLFSMVSGFLVIGCIPLMTSDYKLSMLIYSVQAALLPVMLLGTVTNPDWIIAKFLETGVIKWIGRLSYSLYLWQQLFFVPNEFIISDISYLQVWPINLIALLLCASASYYLVERYFIKMGHRIAKPVTSIKTQSVSRPVRQGRQQTPSPPGSNI